MMSLLIKKEIFEEPLARFYIAELTLALESVHELGFIHRWVTVQLYRIDFAPFTILGQYFIDKNPLAS